MARTVEYGLGEFTFPRGWFMVAEAQELQDRPLPVRFFGQELALYRGKSRRRLLHVEPDPTWPGMFRVRWHGVLSDFCNLTRAKDAAIAIALRDFNCEAQEKPLDGTYVRARRRGVGVPLPDPSRVPAASRARA